MENKAIAGILSTIAIYKELAGENSFKVRAFENASRTIEQTEVPVATLVAEESVRDLPGIGEAIAGVITELVTTGECVELTGLRKTIPEGLPELLELQGVGPKKVRALWQELGVTTIDQLEVACRENKVAELAGFGAKTQNKILSSIDFHRKNTGFFLYGQALKIAQDIRETLQKSDLFARIEIAGSLRRGKDIVKDADILVVAKPGADPKKVIAAITVMADVRNDKPDITLQGETKISLRKEGLQADFRIIEEKSFACAYQYFTGSKEHNTAIRSRAKTLGMKVNEYEITSPNGSLYPKDEKEFYRTLGLTDIPPELREADGEIEAAEMKALPELISLKNIKGFFHAHTTYSDGDHGLEELVQACIKRGYTYIGVTDHSSSAPYAGGLTGERLLLQAEDVRRLGKKYAPFRIFHGIESDIRANGSLDYEDKYLAELDFVIASVHSKLNMTKEEATIRLVTVIHNPHTTMLGHSTGRLLLSREGYEYDTRAVLEALQATGVILEHNCHPSRLDAEWRLLKRAGALGVQVAINPDLHQEIGFEHIPIGVTMARKAWLTADQVFNTKNAEEIDEFFKNRKRGTRA